LGSIVRVEVSGLSTGFDDSDATGADVAATAVTDSLVAAVSSTDVEVGRLVALVLVVDDDNVSETRR